MELPAEADVGEAPRQLAIDFTRALTRRDYTAAHALTTASYQQAVPLERMRRDFEEMVPLDWGETEPLEVITTLTEWADRQPDDVGWLYVSIYGDFSSEGVAVIVADGEDGLRIREVEMGRP